MIAAHGSADPRFATVVDSIADRVRRHRPGLDVVVGYLDHGSPLSDAAAGGGIVVPLLLARGHHVTVDVPQQAEGCTIAAALGPDPSLLAVLERRLREAGWQGQAPVALVAAGSAQRVAVEDVRTVGRDLAERLGVEVTTAFLSAATPRFDEIERPPAVASYLLAPGAFHDQLAGSGVPVVGQPIGDAPEVAEIVLARYASGAQPGRTAPA